MSKSFLTTAHESTQGGIGGVTCPAGVEYLFRRESMRIAFRAAVQILKPRRNHRFLARLASVALLTGLASPVLSHADEVILNNGDKLNGKIGLISGGVMKFTSPSLGDINIKLDTIKSYSADSATLRTQDRKFITGAIKEGNASQITLADGKTYNTADIARVNPPQAGWTGAVVANGAVIRGNSNTESLGVSASATLRRDTPDNDDRLTLTLSDNYARTGVGAGSAATADNTGASVAYDIFFSSKFYGYGNIGYYRDYIAALNYRLTPGVGVGYQWVESKDLNFSTEAGVSYLYQDYAGAPISQNSAFRLAYHLDTALNDKVKLFNDVEYVAPFRFGELNRYILTADVGLRANLTKSFFTEFKIVYNRNDHPVPGRLKDDLAYTLGVGWTF